MTSGFISAPAWPSMPALPALLSYVSRIKSIAARSFAGVLCNHSMTASGHALSQSLPGASLECCITKLSWIKSITARSFSRVLRSYSTTATKHCTACWQMSMPSCPHRDRSVQQQQQGPAQPILVPCATQNTRAHKYKPMNYPTVCILDHCSLPLKLISVLATDMRNIDAALLFCIVGTTCSSQQQHSPCPSHNDSSWL